MCFVPGSEVPELPVHVVESMFKALKMNSEEARLRFPRLLQIIELYPSETLDIMTKEVSVLKPKQIFQVQILLCSGEQLEIICSRHQTVDIIRLHSNELMTSIF